MDGSTLESLAEIPDAHCEGVNQVALNDEGTLLASAGLDCLVRCGTAAPSVVHEQRTR